MFGLEVIAILPFCVAAWRLGQKVSDQQSLLEQHELTINSQQEVLETLAKGSNRRVPQKVLVLVSVATVGAISLHYACKLYVIRQNVAPPPTYTPVVATFEAEECIVCLTNKKDTFFSPCQHFSTCWPCSQRFKGRCCPVCRQLVEYTQFTYVS